MNDDTYESNAQPSTDSESGPVLTAEQRDLLGELEQLDPTLAKMYRGALHALCATQNPERFVHAAHSLRELLEKLAHRLGGPVASGPTFDKDLRDLRQKWPGYEAPSTFDPTNAPELTEPLADLLGAAAAFFARFDSQPHNRRGQLARMFGATDPQKRRMSAPVEGIHTSRWLNLRGNLLAIAHHGRVPDRADFDGDLDKLTELLIDRLRPRTFEQQDMLDQIIAEGEGEP